MVIAGVGCLGTARAGPAGADNTFFLYGAEALGTCNQHTVDLPVAARAGGPPRGERAESHRLCILFIGLETEKIMNVQKIFTKFHTGPPAEPERKNTEMQKMRCKPGPFPV